MTHKSGNLVVSVKARLFGKYFIQIIDCNSTSRHLIAIRAFREKWFAAKYIADLPECFNKGLILHALQRVQKCERRNGPLQWKQFRQPTDELFC